jgi:ATP-dependent Clp protease adaptor protein ClpS
MKYEVNKKELVDLVVGTNNKPPSLYQVTLHNDDFTPMEFVVELLEKLFYMSRHKAVEVMLEAHAKGIAVCGTYTKEVAEFKIMEVIHKARLYEHPLICSMDVA